MGLVGADAYVRLLDDLEDDDFESEDLLLLLDLLLDPDLESFDMEDLEDMLLVDIPDLLDPESDMVMSLLRLRWFVMV